MRRVVNAVLFGVFAAILSLAGPANGQAAPGLATGVTLTPPVAISAAAPSRRALVIAPASAANARAAVAQADATRYRDLLSLLGFEVTVVVAETRPELEMDVRAFAKTIDQTSEIAVFALGAIPQQGDQLYLMTSDPGTAPRPDAYETDGLRLSDIMRKIALPAPRDVVLLVDECVAQGGTACHIGPNTLPDGVSAIIGLRPAAGASGAPLAGIVSLRGEMLPLMQETDLSYLALFGRLQARLEGTNLRLATTPSLTRTFAFLPGDFLARLPSACNAVDMDASAETLKTTRSVAPLETACATAATTYAFSPFFKDKLARVREQNVFEKAAAGCDPAAAQAYLTAYPNGRFRSAVTAVQASCDEARRVPDPPPVTPPRPAPANAQTCAVSGLDPAGNNWLALRTRPSFQSTWSTTRMGPGTIVTTFERDGDWAHVRLASGEIGWANGKFLACDGTAPSPHQAVAQASSCTVDGLDPAGNNWLALREAPSFQAAWSSTHMGPGTEVTIIGRSGGWMHVRLRTGESGWANARFLRCDE